MILYSLAYLVFFYITLLIAVNIKLWENVIIFYILRKRCINYRFVARDRRTYLACVSKLRRVCEYVNAVVEMSLLFLVRENNNAGCKRECMPTRAFNYPQLIKTNLDEISIWPRCKCNISWIVIMNSETFNDNFLICLWADTRANSKQFNQILDFEMYIEINFQRENIMNYCFDLIMYIRRL